MILYRITIEIALSVDMSVSPVIQTPLIMTCLTGPNCPKELKKSDPTLKGTIDIVLRKHLYCAKLNLTGFFVKTKEFLFQHYILTKISYCTLIFLVHKEKCLKNS